MNDGPPAATIAERRSAPSPSPHFADAAALEAYLSAVFPQWQSGGGYGVAAIGDGTATLRLAHDESQLRPGGTISGPTMMTLADVAAYAAILGAIGEVPLAVTTSLNINFLMRPRPGDILGQACVLKLGQRLAVCEIDILSGDDLVAHATATYSIPPPERR